ncbi:unnamed protein product [Sphagnum jensenii]|uniref:Metallothionein n=1 Tax=Sphagnum jensenii TaxID=128206 RepID=A0ABP0VM07_9BRYO
MSGCGNSNCKCGTNCSCGSDCNCNNCRHTYSDNLYIFCYALNNSYNSENDCKCGPNCNCADCNCHK